MKSEANSLSQVMEEMGIEEILFQDRGEAPVFKMKPELHSYNLPAVGGGTVLIKKGDHIQFRELYNKQQGEQIGYSGIVISIFPEVDGAFYVLYERDGKEDWQGNTSCLVYPNTGDQYRIVEKI